MATQENINTPLMSEISLDLLPVRERKARCPSKIPKSVPKTSCTMEPISKRAKRSGAISRAGHHRWPQATMVVKGGKECQIFTTEVLSVSTKYEKDNGKLCDNYRRSHEENSFETKTTLPDIFSSSTSKLNYNTEETDLGTALIQSITRSTSKATRFHKKYRQINEKGNQPEAKTHKAKSIRNIKFWRGTTPAAREAEKNDDNKFENENYHNDEVNDDPETLQDSILQSWNEQVNILEESDKHKFFTWQMALRERLIKHEKLHYHQALTRINKYREKLKQEPSEFITNSKKMQSKKDIQMWKAILPQHNEINKLKFNSNLAPGISMSPTQEWKQHISNRNDHGKDVDQDKALFFGKSAIPANNTIKKHTKRNNNVVPVPTASSRKPNMQSSSDTTCTNYPVHGEGIFKAVNDTKSSLPNVEHTKQLLVTPTMDLSSATLQSHKQQRNKGRTSTEVQEMEDVTMKSLLGNLQQERQLRESGHNQTRDNIRGRTAPAFQASTVLGAKLKKLLNNNNDQENFNGVRSVATAKYNRSRSRLNSQSTDRSFRPIRPNSLGNGSLPKLHTIIASTLRKQPYKTTEREEMKVKHRLTLTGVANRMSFSSSVIGISKIHIPHQNNENEANSTTTNNGSEVTEMPQASNYKFKNQHNTTLEVISHKSQQLQDSSQHNFKETPAKTEKQNKPFHKDWEQKHSAYTIPANAGTSASLLPHRHGASSSFKKDLKKENSQYVNLKLTSSFSTKQDKVLPSMKEGNKIHQAIKNKKQVGKQNVLQMAVVEPPLSVHERHRRQQRLEIANRQSNFNPAHVALSNFKAAILNSELNLRAPSSSPVDMTGKSYNNQQPPQHSTANFWKQKPGGIKLVDSRKKQNLPINNNDGMQQSHLQMALEIAQLNGTNRNTNYKVNTTPKLNNLTDLQRLYHVIKKHEEVPVSIDTSCYSNQSQVPKKTQEADTISKQASKQINQKNTHKKLYYSYSNKVDNRISQSKDSFLNIVTFASSVSTPRNQNDTTRPNTTFVQKSHSENTHRVRFRQYLSNQPQSAGTGIPSKSWEHVDYENKTFNKLRQSQRHELTVMMPKTPGIVMTASIPMTQLEQIKEHAVQ